MKLSLVLAVGFILSLEVVLSLRKCYRCNSGTSREDCETNQKEKNCTGSEEQCFQFEMTFTVGSNQTKMFEKGCEAPEKCEKYDKDSGEEICKANLPDGGNLDTCKAKCCSGDLCNKENIFNVSHMVFGRCYTCNSDTSLEDCETNQLVNNCTGSEEKCFQFEMTFTVGSEQRKVFEKGCEAPEKCEKFDKDSEEEICKANLTDGGHLDTCKAKCCSGDLCNKENIFNGGHMVFGRCYTCNSDTSHEDCETNQLVNNCTGSEEKCLQFEMTFTVGSEQRKVFEKGCEAPEKCEKYNKESGKELCKANLTDGGNLDTCKAKCCSGDLCNKENIFNGGHMVFGSFLLPSTMVVISMTIS